MLRFFGIATFKIGPVNNNCAYNLHCYPEPEFLPYFFKAGIVE